MTVNYIWEHNGNDTLLYADNFPGAYARGESREAAFKKLEPEIKSFLLWRDGISVSEPVEAVLVGEYETSSLNVSDADSDALFETERLPLILPEYEKLKEYALKSAKDFQILYDSIPDKDATCLIRRQTFYGERPVTAAEMYEHTKNVNEYYFNEINVPASNEPDIFSCRLAGFDQLEKQPDFLKNIVYDGSYGEQWSLRKVCRRFIWHDRIHAKAMWRMAVQVFGKNCIANPFYFKLKM